MRFPAERLQARSGLEQGQRDQRSQGNRDLGHRTGIRGVKADLKVDINKGL